MVSVLGQFDYRSALAAGQGAPQIVGDVTQWDTLAAPGDDIHGALMAELEAGILRYGAADVECHSSQYGFTDQDVANAFAQIGVNANSRFLFDKTQAAGHVEGPIITAFKAQVPAGRIAIGTSPDHGAILHTKAVALLYPDGTGWTLTGSWNVSASAQEQFNIVDVIRSRSRSELFADKIDQMFTWVATHEVQS